MKARAHKFRKSASIRMDSGLHEELAAIAGQCDVPISTLVDQAVSGFVNEARKAGKIRVVIDRALSPCDEKGHKNS
jgi:hypothetical protein